MEGIIQAIIVGVFGLAGVWLKHYLDDRKASRPVRMGDRVGGPSRGQTMDNDAPGSPLPPPRPRSASGPEVRALPWISAPVVGTAGIVTFSVASGFFALWVFSYVMGVFNVTVPAVPGNWIAILLAGLAWGGAYVIVGYRLAAEWPDHLLGPLTPYLLMTEADGPGDVVLSLLSASPLNVFLSWGAAVGIGVAASDHLGADQSGVIFLVFGLLTAISLTWFTLQDA